MKTKEELLLDKANLEVEKKTLQEKLARFKDACGKAGHFGLNPKPDYIDSIMPTTNADLQYCSVCEEAIFVYLDRS